MIRSFDNKIGVIHFIGIGGIGMSGIAEVLINLGFLISGSDITENQNVLRLRNKQIKVDIGHNKKNIEYMRNKYPDATIIGGGGVQTPEHIELYKSFGANHISVSSLCFNPIKFLRFYYGIN